MLCLHAQKIIIKDYHKKFYRLEINTDLIVNSFNKEMLNFGHNMVNK